MESICQSETSLLGEKKRKVSYYICMEILDGLVPTITFKYQARIMHAMSTDVKFCKIQHIMVDSKNSQWKSFPFNEVNLFNDLPKSVLNINGENVETYKSALNA